MQHIVIDGGSTDGTVELLEDAPNIEWISEPDMGQSDAINKGLSRAEGHILTWLNADDALAPGALAKVVQRFGQDPNVGWVTGRGRVTRETGTSVEPVFPLRDYDLDFGNPVVQPSTFFLKDAFVQAGEVDRTLHYAMDLDLWLRFVSVGLQRTFEPSVLSHIIYDSSSKTGGLDPVLFFQEEFLVYTRHHRAEAALLALGRVAAYRAAGSGALRDLSVAARAAAAWGLAHGAEAKVQDVIAAARVEAFFLEMHRQKHPRAVRHLLGLAPWSLPSGRKRLFHGLRRKGPAPLLKRALSRHLVG